MAHILEVLRTERERRIQIGAEDLVRPLSFGTNWTRVRVVMRYTLLIDKIRASNMEYFGGGGGTAATAAPARLFVGLCAGSKGYGSASPDCVVGMANRIAQVVTAQTANSGYYTAVAIDPCFTKGSTGARFAVSATGSTLFSCAPVRISFCTDITKSYDAVSGYRLNSYTTSSALPYPTTDQSISAVVEAFRQDTGTPTGWILHSGTAMGWTLTDADMDTLDSVCISWNQCLPMMEISNVFVYRLL